MKTAEQIAEKLWRAYSVYSGHYGFRLIVRKEFDAALKEYGEAVRQKAAGVCQSIAFDQRRHNLTGHGAFLCKESIERMELP